MGSGDMVPQPGGMFPAQPVEEGESQQEEAEPMTEQHMAFLQQVRKSSLSLFRPVEFSIKLYTIKSGWPIVYIEVS